MSGKTETKRRKHYYLISGQSVEIGVFDEQDDVMSAKATLKSSGEDTVILYGNAEQMHVVSRLEKVTGE